MMNEDFDDIIFLQKDALLRWQEMTGCQTPHEAREKIQKLTEMNFLLLKNIWLEKTRHHSSMDKITNHPAYQSIIQMGKDVVHLIIRDLEIEPKHWGPALFAITGANPIPKEHAGRVKLIAQDWIEWAKDNGYYK